MDFVPYEFCATLAGILRKPKTIDGAFSSRFWQRAIRKEVENRCNLELAFGYSNGSWAYMMRNRRKKIITFEEFRGTIKQNFHIIGIAIKKMNVAIQLSFDELRSGIDSIHHYMNDPELTVIGYDQQRIPDSISLVSTCSFRKIDLWNDPSLFENLLKKQMEKTTLKFIFLRSQNTFSPVLKSALEQFVLKKEFDRVKIDCLKTLFCKGYFARIFHEKRSNGTFIGSFAFKLSYLEAFREDLQMCRDKDKKSIIWMRGDDRIEVTINGGKKLTIQFTINAHAAEF